MKIFNSKIFCATIAALTLLNQQLNFVLKYPRHLFTPNHTDEFTYLSQVFLNAQGKSISSFYKEHDQVLSFSEIIKLNVSSITDYLIGKIGLMIGVDIFTYGLMLDLFCIFTAFFLLSKITALFASDKATANICALLAIVTPCALSFDQIQIFPIVLTKTLINAPISYVTSPASIRGVYTQIGFLFFLSSIYFSLRGIAGRYSPKSIIIAGALSGASMYVYFFAWIAAGFACLALFAGTIILNCRNKPELLKLFKAAALYSTGLALVSAPGVLLVKQGSSLAQVCSPEISHYWYFSPECLLIVSLIVLMAIYFNSYLQTALKNFTPFICLLTATLAAPLILMNLQPLLSCIISPFRFFLYIFPLSTALAFLFLHAIFTKVAPKRIRNLFILFSLFMACCNNPHSDTFMVLSDENIELMDYIHENKLNGDTFAIWIARKYYDKVPEKFPYKLMPNGLSTMEGIKLLSQSWIYPADISIAEATEREGYLNWVFRHNVKYENQLVMPCNSNQDSRDYLPGDIFDMTWTANLLLREKMCAYLKEHPLKVCDLINRFKLDYVIWDLKKESPLVERPYLEPIWSSSNKKILVYKFNKQLALEQECWAN